MKTCGQKKVIKRHLVGPNGWNYDFFWSVRVYTQFLAKCRTDMGHVDEYVADGSDLRQAIMSPFKEPATDMTYIAENYGKTHMLSATQIHASS